MKNEKHCLCCDTVSAFYVYKGGTLTCCDRCNRTFTAVERKSKVMANVLNLIKPIIDNSN